MTPPTTPPAGRAPAPPRADQVHRARPPRTAPAPRVRDSQRARVYRAEDAWAGRLDAARRGAVLATVAGSALVLPPERRFGSLDAVAAFADRVLAQPEVVAVAGPVPAPALRARRGTRSAHWEPPGTLALPVPRHGEPWALRESVVLHELAHHLGETAGLCAGHAAPFPALVLLLVGTVLGDEAALALRVSYGEHGVAVGSVPVRRAAP